MTVAVAGVDERRVERETNAGRLRDEREHGATHERVEIPKTKRSVERERQCQVAIANARVERDNTLLVSCVALRTFFYK